MDQPNLIRTYQDMMASLGHKPKAAVDAINDELGTNYETNDFGKWRRGDRPTPQPVQDFMVRAVIEHAVRTVGGKLPKDDASIDRLAAMLCPPTVGESAHHVPV